MSLGSPTTTVNGSTKATADRDAIVAALDSVDGLTGYPLMPDQATAGAAWPRWVQTTYDGALCTLARDVYDVVVILPGDYLEHTVDQGDGFRDVAARALMNLGHISLAEPVQVTFDDRQTMPGLRFRLTAR
jgi:hypothetical protein